MLYNTKHMCRGHSHTQLHDCAIDVKHTPIVLSNVNSIGMCTHANVTFTHTQDVGTTSHYAVLTVKLLYSSSTVKW